MVSDETLLLLPKENDKPKGKLMRCDTIETCSDLIVLSPGSKKTMRSMITKPSKAYQRKKVPTNQITLW